METLGYPLLACASFSKAEFSTAAQARVSARLSPECRALLADVKPQGWYPRTRLVEHCAAIAGEYGDSPTVSRAFVRLGEHMAREMTTVWIRLLMRIMTPGLLAKKMPELFAKGNRGDGHVVIDSSEIERRRMTFVFRSMRGYGYYQPINEGWIRYFFRGMGNDAVDTTSDPPWSIEAVDPEIFQIDASW
jgi:hypothetical protein